ncbi:MAG: hypothetical protein ABIJ97_10940 [Bacteroidota bacterium]
MTTGQPARRTIIESLYLKENIPYIRENIHKKFNQLSDQDLSMITPELKDEMFVQISRKTGLTKSEIANLIYMVNTKINFSNFFG